ncbi:hypothetical protein KFK09_022927 [Dendrobium nobile]|uniref:Retrotransposon Copia-like N-terminal domain-containing protein n=1 Tax=Dendrobium nobile TaxID=94219 RepID=A0A8T3AK15_DENNO|nr:hypothetical protein KFK09_022927 [Dendrobium nobile]
MAQSSVSSQIGEPTEAMTEGSTIPTSLKFMISNIRNMIPTQLTSENYSIWKSQIIKLLKANGFLQFLLPNACPPEKDTQTDEGKIVENPQYA